MDPPQRRCWFSRAARTDTSLARASLDAVWKKQLAEEPPDLASTIHLAALRFYQQPNVELPARDLLFAEGDRRDDDNDHSQPDPLGDLNTELDNLDLEL